MSSDQENQSPGNSEPQPNDALGTIMQTASLSAGKRHRHQETGSDPFTQSQRRITASDFKDFRGHDRSSSSQKTDSNMASLVFKPRDSDAAAFTHHHASISLNSNKMPDSNRKQRNSSGSGGGPMQKHASHPSFGMSGTAGLASRTTQAADRWGLMAEKCALRLLAKDLFVQMSRISEIFQRRQVQQEVILSNHSTMQLKSFLDISMNSSLNVLMSASERDMLHDELREKSLAQL